MSRTKNWERKAIIEARTSGMLIKQIAHKFDRDAMTVAKILRQGGFPVHWRPPLIREPPARAQNICGILSLPC